MAECRSSESSVDQDDPDNDDNVPGWTDCQDSDSDSHQRKYYIIYEIMKNRKLNHLRTILASGWDVNELFHIQNDYENEYQVALNAAVKSGWTEGVKMLLDVGAKMRRSDKLENLLCLALCTVNYQDTDPELIKLLLEHGADPNDHDDKKIPLLYAINDYYYTEEREEHRKNVAIIVQLLLAHGANANVTTLVEPGRFGPTKHTQYTALHEAASHGWTEVVQMLLDAGAECKTSNGRNPLALAASSYDCSPNLIKLLLKYGADPNDHDGQFANVPLLAAIAKQSDKDTIIVDLLLEHGANPNVTYKDRVYRQPMFGEKQEESTALHVAGRSGCTEVVKRFLGADNVTSGILSETLAEALRRGNMCQPDLVELLIKQGADINYTLVGNWPLIHEFANLSFPQQSLDLFFLHGGNINTEHGIDRTALECGGHKTALEYAVKDGYAQVNMVRWLIRHGADVSRIMFTWLREGLRPDPDSKFPPIPLILLQAGMRVSHRAHTQLSNMEMAISAWLQEDRGSIYITLPDCWDAPWEPDHGRQDADISRTVHGLWEQLKEAEEEEVQWVQSDLKKSTFPKYFNLQMVDLKEFSDQSLYVYPKYTEDTDESHTEYPEGTIHTDYGMARREYKNELDQIRRVLKFLNHPRTLQWHCRLCIREKLVSLQPSVVKTLPLPARLKRYMLCHEI